MHLLVAQPGRVTDGAEAIDLKQSPGDIVVLSAADTELALLSAARAGMADDGFPSLRLASLLHLGHPMSVDLYLDQTVSGARLVIVRLLGGRGYWPYGVEQLVDLGRARGIPVAFLPGDDQPDPDLAGLSTLPRETAHRLWQYLVHGGPDNAAQFLRLAAHALGVEAEWREPKPLVRAGLYMPGRGVVTLDEVRRDWRAERPAAALVFYRALVQAGNLAPVDALIAEMRATGLNPVAVFVASLKDRVAAATLTQVLDTARPDVILNATGFAVAAPGSPSATPFGAVDCPVLQVVFAGSDVAGWRDGNHGLAARDIAMNVALPEVDGRILSRAVSFKGLARRDPLTETDIVRYDPVADRVAFVCELARAWVRLRRTPTDERRVALVIANYPNRDGRLGNGVGLDVPASVVDILRTLADSGYRAGPLPADGQELIGALLAGPTNNLAGLDGREVTETLALDDYRAYFDGLADDVRARVTERWGPPDRDPHVACGAFAIAAVRYGNVVVGVQPARGYNIDPKASYHDPDLPPPHAYLAFYAWLRLTFGAHAVVHVGKHGNLEWLPGKAVALSRSCFPEAALGPLPHLYPFIVNDPGEGTQAKRRAHAVIIDHLTPPLTRAESYGPLRDLERLVDEYYEASGLDNRRLVVLARDILELCQSSGIDRDCGIEAEDGEGDALVKLDRYLCELKEMQIRDGLHVFGRSPKGRLRVDLLVALARVPRGDGKAANASLLRALAEDLGLDMDPLDADPSTSWTGARPDALAGGDDPWRTAGDTIERLEGLAAGLVAGERTSEPGWTRTSAVLDWLEGTLCPDVDACGEREMTGLLAGLDGRFVAPGPSGAPTRGRADVLPTGRNFYSVDTRAVPTPAAWTLGWKSAGLLVERYVQDHGQWPERLALTAWGTSNMRTGGDDIAQALALLGVQPTWEPSSRRVTGFEILPVRLLDRPRVDVTLRISGFFRDAFPNLVDLVDSAVRAVAELDEPAEDNPIAARVRADRDALVTDGRSDADARRLAGARVFGSKPGAYGAGLQALIDEKGWQTDADLARAYVVWGGYAYGAGLHGEAAHDTFEERLKAADAVVQNQDNREHDILDSDDYYQFEGGMTAAVRTLSGRQPAVYHGDHARPESPVIRTLGEELGRVVRARVVNPKWIEGAMRHGYKGGFEMAATVDYLFAFAATANCVADHHFDAVFDAYIEDDRVRDFLADQNPDALREMSDRLLEAQDRGLWKPRSNSAHETLTDLARRPVSE
jgi:cobaltochelatase CobN